LLPFAGTGHTNLLVMPKLKRTARSQSNRSFNKVFRDPVHDLIRLGSEDEFILRLIDTREFQRLRRIKQLGIGYFVYPGAEHTRFAHSLGVFYFARRMIERLRVQCDTRTRQELDLNGPVIKAAALLHDIGHGPFSHVFERVFERDEEGARQVLDHEGWTSRIILDSSSEVHHVLAESGIDAKSVAVLITDKPPAGFEPPVDPYLKDIVHSQLDADRMDYLLRDSLMTGSRFGQFDAEWILNVLAIGELRSGKGRIRKLCLDASKGIGAIEGMLLARLNMTKYVYGHKTTRAYEAELLSLLRLAGELVSILPDETPVPVRNFLKKRGDVEIKDYLLLDDEVMWWAIRRWAVWKPALEADRHALADALSRHSLRLVRRQHPWRTRRLRTSQELRQAASLVEELRGNRDDRLRFEWHLDTMSTWPYKEPARRVRRGEDPEQAYFEDIHVVKDGEAVPIQEAEESGILNALAEPWAEHRFHFDPKYFEEFTGHLRMLGLS